MTDKPLNLAFHRKQLEEWIAAYRLDRLLREPVAQGDPTADLPPESISSTTLAPGHVRLLRPSAVSLPESERPVYVLLMPGKSDDTMTLIPFSRYTVPATPQEWRTGLRRSPLRVLCLWNQRLSACAELQTSWLVTTIRETKQAEVERLLDRPNELAVYPARRFGPPLLNPLDPRHTYLQEERTLLDDLCVVSERASVIEYPMPEANTQQLRAAEDSPEYGEPDIEEAGDE